MTAGPRVPHRPADPRDGGFAVVVVLLFLMAVTALIAPLALAARTELLVAANRMQQDRLALVAEGAFTVLARDLAAPPIEPRSPALTVRSEPLRCVTEALAFEVRVQDQAGLADLNMAPPGLLEAGFVALGFGRGEAAGLARAVVAYRLPAGGEGESPRVPPGAVVAGLKQGAFEAIEELYDFDGLADVPAAALAEVFTIHNATPAIVGPVMSRRLSQILPAAPTPRYPFIAAEPGEPPRLYRIDVTVGDRQWRTRSHHGALLRASEEEGGAFQPVEPVTNPAFLPGEADGFGAAEECDRLFGVGAAAALARIEG